MVFAVVATVLAMHGLTMNHDATTADGPLVSAVTSLMAHGTSGTVDVPESTIDFRPAHAELKSPDASSVASPSMSHVMGDACLAFLTGFALLVLLRRKSLRVRPDTMVASLVRCRAHAIRAVGLLTPDLAELSVLRT